MRLEWPRFELRMKLYTDKPRMIVVFDNLRENAIRRHAAKPHAVLFETGLVVGIDLIAVSVPLGNFYRSVDFRRTASRLQLGRIGAKPHGASEIAPVAAFLKRIAAQPLCHQANDRMRRRAELGGICVLDAAQVPRGLHNRHLHAEANAEIRHVPLAGKLRRADLALGAALSETARDQDAVDMFKEGGGILALEHFALDPVEIDPYLVGDAAVAEGLD